MLITCNAGVAKGIKDRGLAKKTTRLLMRVFYANLKETARSMKTKSRRPTTRSQSSERRSIRLRKKCVRCVIIWQTRKLKIKILTTC